MEGSNYNCSSSCCSDDTDFLMVQANRCSVKGFVDDRSSTTTDLLYQRDDVHEEGVLSDFKNSPESFLRKFQEEARESNEIPLENSNEHSKDISNKSSNYYSNLPEYEEKNNGGVKILEEMPSKISPLRLEQKLDSHDIQPARRKDNHDLLELDDKVKEGQELLMRFLGDTTRLIGLDNGNRMKDSSRYIQSSLAFQNSDETKRTKRRSLQSDIVGVDSHPLSQSLSSTSKQSFQLMETTTDRSVIAVYPNLSKSAGNSYNPQTRLSRDLGVNSVAPLPEKYDSLTPVVTSTPERAKLSLKMSKSDKVSKYDKGDGNNEFLSTKQDVESCKQLADHHEKRAIYMRKELLTLEEQRFEIQSTLNELSVKVDVKKEEMSRIMELGENARLVNSRQSEVALIKRECNSLKSELKDTQTVLAEQKQDSMKDRANFLLKIDDLQRELRGNEARYLEEKSELLQQLKAERLKISRLSLEQVNAVALMKEDQSVEKEREIELLRTKQDEERRLMIKSLDDAHMQELTGLEEMLLRKEQCIDECREEITELMATTSSLKLKLSQSQEHCNQQESMISEMRSLQEKKEREFQDEIDRVQENCKNFSSDLLNSGKVAGDQQQEINELKRSLADEQAEHKQDIEAKNQEILLYQERLKSQEAATRLLGDNMRGQAQEQVKNAVEETCKGLKFELASLEEKLLDMESQKQEIIREHEKATDKKNDILTMIQTSNGKLKKEVEAVKTQLYTSQRETIEAAAKSRSDARYENEKLRERNRELTRIDKRIALEIAEECAKLTIIIEGTSALHTSPSRFSHVQGKSSPSSIHSSLDALVNLRRSLDSVKHHLLASKGKEGTKQKQNDVIRQMEIRLEESDQQHRLELERQEKIHQHQMNLLTPNKTDGAQNHSTSTSIISNKDYHGDVSCHSSSDASDTSTGSHAVKREASTTRLLQHLQQRVKQLRIENQSLRLIDDSEENDSDAESACSTIAVESANIQSSVYNIAEDRVVNLEDSLQKAAEQAEKNVALLNRKMTEMTKLQCILTQSTKENMKLERAYANLQQRVVGHYEPVIVKSST